MDEKDNLRSEIRNRIIKRLEGEIPYRMSNLHLSNTFYGLFKEEINNEKNTTAGNRNKVLKYTGIILEEIQRLINIGILANGTDLVSADHWGWLFLTEYGKKCIEEKSIFLLYDPEEYIDNIKKVISI